MKRLILPCLAALAFGATGCEENAATGLDPGLFPIEPQTEEIRLPWSVFGDRVSVLGGYGLASELGVGYLANDFEGVLTARTLARVQPWPDSVSVVVDGSTVTSGMTFAEGRFVARFDTAESLYSGPVTVTLRDMSRSWHPRSATWTVAVDSLGDRQEWAEPGAGPADSVASGVWDPSTGDSLVIPLDSLTLTRWEDPDREGRGIRLDVESNDARLEVSGANFRLDVRPEAKTDTLITLNAAARELTHISIAEAGGPGDDLVVGGVPAWRSILFLDLPVTLTGPPSLCARVGCPFTLEADRINSASLLLTTKASDPAFRPADSVLLDVRPVLVPERLPKSPLGESLLTTSGQLGLSVGPSAWTGQEGRQLAVPVTGFIRDLVRGETQAGTDAPDALALLTVFEPISPARMLFRRPGEVGEPELRLIVTTPDTVEFR